MSDPVTATLILTAAATALSAVGAVSQGQQAKSAAEFNARQAERNAAIARQRAAGAAERIRRQAGREEGRRVAGFLASGIQLAGSPLDFLADAAAEAELEARLAEQGGAIESASLLERADVSRFEGQQAQTAGFLSAGRTILGGAAAAFDTPTTEEPEDEIVVPGSAGGGFSGPLIA